MQSTRKVLTWLSLLAPVLMVTCCYLCPVPAMQPMAVFEKEFSAEPRTQTMSRQFRVTRSPVCQKLSLASDTRQGEIRVVMEDGSEKHTWRVWPGEQTSDQPVWNLRLRKTYTIRVEEIGFAGSCRFALYPAWDHAEWTKLAQERRKVLAAFGLALLGLILAGAFLLSEKSPPLHRPPPLALLLPFVPLLDVIYGILHEGGHVLALGLFGGADLASSDFLGLSGQAFAHSLGRALLADWQDALVRISGPLLPSLVAYVAFGCAMLYWRRNPRFFTGLLGAGLLMVLLRLLLSHLLLLPEMAGFLSDGANSDYPMFLKRYHGSVWLFQVAALSTALVNVWMMAQLVRRFLAQRRVDSEPRSQFQIQVRHRAQRGRGHCAGVFGQHAARVAGLGRFPGLAPPFQLRRRGSPG